MEDAWPRPQLSWRLDTAEGGVEESLASGGQEWVESSQEAASPHLVTVTRSLAYTARLAEDGANLTCIVTQVNILDIQRIYPRYLPVTPGGGRPGDRAAAQCAAPGAARHRAQEQRRHGARQQGEDRVIYEVTQRHHADTADIAKVGLVSLIFVSLLAVVLVLVMVTMLGLRRR